MLCEKLKKNNIILIDSIKSLDEISSVDTKVQNHVIFIAIISKFINNILYKVSNKLLDKPNMMSYNF